MATRAGEPSNPHLVRAMREVALKDSYLTRRALYDALLRSVLLVPVANPPHADGWKTLSEDTTLQFVATRGPDGQKWLLAFSDSLSLQRWKPSGSSFVGLEAMTLFGVATQNEFDAIIVNVAGPTGGEITRVEFELLARGISPTDSKAA